MSKPDKSIDPRILQSAREEFLSKPYEQVSLREICQKAGVTTGAFYNRYKNKEELFDALVAPTLKTVAAFGDATERFNYDQLHNQDMRRVWCCTPITTASGSCCVMLRGQNMQALSMILSAT